MNIKFSVKNKGNKTGSMAINDQGTFSRTAHDENSDARQALENLQAESWKSWPNEAGFDGLQEHRGPIDLKVRGTIPPWASGSLYRTGPGQATVRDTALGDYHISHWFDGLAHTHKFDISADPAAAGGVSVKYSSRRQSEALAEDIKMRGWRRGTSFAQRADPCVGIFAKVMSTFTQSPPLRNNCVVVERNVPGLDSQQSDGVRNNSNNNNAQFEKSMTTKNVFIMTDNNTFQKVNPQTLEPIEYKQATALHPLLTGPMGCAHSQRDPQTGDLFNFNTRPGLKTTYRVYRVNAATGTTHILATISSPDVKPAYIHSLFLTQNYVVLCIPSSHLAWSGAKVALKGNIAEGIGPFDEGMLSQWFVVDRRGGRGVVARFTTPAGFFFHSVNSFEEEVVDGEEKKTVLNFELVAYRNCDIIHSFYYDVMRNENGATKSMFDKFGYDVMKPTLTRYRFEMPPNPYHPNKPIPAAENVLSIGGPHAGELPTINNLFATRPHRYVYSASTRGLSTMFDSLCKTDTKTCEAVIWAPEKGHTPGEPIFVARPGSEGEDDGVLLSVVLDGGSQKSYLVCLDAKNMVEMGRAECEFAIGFGFHGVHDSGSRL